MSQKHPFFSRVFRRGEGLRSNASRLRGALIALGAMAPFAAAQHDGNSWVIQAGRVETGTGEVLERAAILVEAGVITAVGYDLEVPLGTPKIDAREWTVVPGWVHPTSRQG